MSIFLHSTRGFLSRPKRRACRQIPTADVTGRKAPVNVDDGLYAIQFHGGTVYEPVGTQQTLLFGTCEQEQDGVCRPYGFPYSGKFKNHRCSGGVVDKAVPNGVPLLRFAESHVIVMGQVGNGLSVTIGITAGQQSCCEKGGNFAIIAGERSFNSLP